jgi:hypothetical protein
MTLSKGKHLSPIFTIGGSVAGEKEKVKLQPLTEIGSNFP